MCVGVIIGGVIIFIDWFLLKKMSFYFVRGNRGAMFGSLVRYIFIGLLLLFVFCICKLNVWGVLWGISIVPLSLVLVTFYLTFNYLFKVGGN